MIALYNDILFLVLEHLHDEKDRLRLLLVCRGWYTILLPKAYQRINVQDLQIYGFVCSIQRNPDIGLYIQNLHLSWGWYPMEDLSIEYDLEPFEDTINQLSLSAGHRVEWETQLFEGKSHAWLALLLPSLKAVRALTVQCPGFSDSFFLMLARVASREAPFDKNPVLQRLQTVHAEYESVKSHHFSAEFWAVMQFPALRSFSASRMCEENYGRWLKFSKCKPAFKTSGVTKLQFDRSNARAGMNDFITTCANLQVFEYQHDNQAIWSQVYLNFRPGQFYLALYTQKHSLQVLRLNDKGEHEDIDEEWDSEDEMDYSSFGSLEDFGQLRELRIPLRVLLQFGPNDYPAVSLQEVLPSSLEHLLLAAYYVKDFGLVMSNVQNMLRKREERFPNLKRLEIQPVDVELDETTTIAFHTMKTPQHIIQSFAPLRMQCEDLGIHFGFIVHT
ncbi:hypothetical protein N7466_005845 [Penicillium verhagenii]|uniref:uncharacterized protein n=1 Tax=Penicillium verhagenii TaxID=1562060 RepID=UPI0025458CE4|nr:uncharacterized protein N7466_005845 [Penicillium verhagenii]KAJ5930352.1 hypothetical protein N7466_005845 [Penicillium verhagenii]